MSAFEEYQDLFNMFFFYESIHQTMKYNFLNVDELYLFQVRWYIIPDVQG